MLWSSSWDCGAIRQRTVLFSKIIIRSFFKNNKAVWRFLLCFFFLVETHEGTRPLHNIMNSFQCPTDHINANHNPINLSPKTSRLTWKNRFAHLKRWNRKDCLLFDWICIATTFTSMGLLKAFTGVIIVAWKAKNDVFRNILAIPPV